VLHEGELLRVKSAPSSRRIVIFETPSVGRCLRGRWGELVGGTDGYKGIKV
jgi:hypothetical protein